MSRRSNGRWLPWLGSVFGAGFRISRGLAQLAMVAALVLLAAFNSALILSEAVFRTVTTAVSTATGLATAATGTQNRIRNLESSIARQQGELERLRRTAAHQEARRQERRNAARAIKSRLHGRITRIAGANVAATAGEALPVVGIGFIAGVTAWEIRQLCLLGREVRDLADLVAGEGAEAIDVIEAQVEDDVSDTLTLDATFCGVDLPPAPSAAEIVGKIGAGFGSTWDSAVGGLEPYIPDVYQWAPEKPAWPDLRRSVTSTIEWGQDWFSEPETQ